MAVLISSRESPVGEAPPLTKLGADSASPGRRTPPSPGAIGPDIEAEPEPSPPDPSSPGAPARSGSARSTLSASPGARAAKSIYVSADDATLREYRIKNGDLDPPGLGAGAGRSRSACSSAAGSPCSATRTRRASR